MDRADYALGKRLSRELVLLGMALGGEKSRLKITNEVDPRRLNGARDQMLMIAAREGDREAVVAWAQSMGVTVGAGESVVDAFVREVSQTDDRARLARLMAEVSIAGKADSLESIRSILSDGLDMIATMQAGSV